MLQRFSDDARRVVVDARAEARGLQHGWVGTEHLVLAMLQAPETLAGRELTARGVTYDSVRSAVAAAVPPGSPGTTEELDAEALRAIGVDLDAVRESVEAAFGEGALDGALEGGRRGRARVGVVSLRFTRRAKKVLALALRETAAMDQRSIRDGHILLGVLRDGGWLATTVLREAGVELDALRDSVRSRLSATAPG